MLTVGHDSNSVTQFTKSNDCFYCSRYEGDFSRCLFENINGKTRKNTRDSTCSIFWCEITAIQVFCQALPPPSLDTESNDESTVQKRSVHIEEGEAINGSDTREDV